MKKAFNLTLDLSYKIKFIDIINGFIDHKKNDINDTNDENKKNLNVSNPLIWKQHEHLSNKHIKSALENNLHINTKNSTLNLPDLNLYISFSKNSLHINNNK